MNINIEKLINFLDNPKKGDNKHASAIIGILGEDINAAAFTNYLKRHNNGKVVILNQSPRPGTKKGKRLDRWIYVKENKNKKEVLYQCEIKNWAASAIGGKKLPIDSSKEEIKRVADFNWKRQIKKHFQDKKEQPNLLTKVLLTMKSPEQYSKIKIEPLLIYWMPVLKLDGDLNPLFSISVKNLNMLNFPDSSFDVLNIFSVSLYLRNLLDNGVKTFSFCMPDAERRIEILNDILD